MYLTGMVDKRTLEKYEKEAKEKNPLPNESNEEANMLMETDVGIIEYLSKLSGFSGIIKQR